MSLSYVVFEKDETGSVKILFVGTNRSKAKKIWEETVNESEFEKTIFFQAWKDGNHVNRLDHSKTLVSSEDEEDDEEYYDDEEEE